MPLTLERRYRFSAAHLYRRPDWSEEENRRRFGKCAIEPGHGHNYRLHVSILGPVDPATGFVCSLPAVDKLVEKRVVEPLDHRHVNHAVERFAPGGEIPTSESLVLWIHDQLDGALPEGQELVRLRLEEDEDLAAEWRLEDQGS